MTLRKAQTSGLLLATLAALHTAAAWPAAAQVRYGMPESSTLLVTPEGDLLGFVPEAGEVIISRDRLGVASCSTTTAILSRRKFPPRPTTPSAQHALSGGIRRTQ